MSQTISEIVWISGIFEHLGFQVPRAIDLYCGNKSANHIAHNLIFHERTKHLTATMLGIIFNKDS